MSAKTFVQPTERASSDAALKFLGVGGSCPALRSVWHGHYDSYATE